MSKKDAVNFRRPTEPEKPKKQESFLKRSEMVRSQARKSESMLFQGLDKNVPVATSIKPSRKINVRKVNEQSSNQQSTSVNLRYQEAFKQAAEPGNPLTQTQQSKHSRGNTARSSSKIMNI